MIKKRQKWIAVLVVITFAWLLQVSAMPVGAADAPAKIEATGNEQGPRSIEEESDSGFVGKKKSILPIVLIGVGVIAVAAILFLVVLADKYNPVGSWSGPMTRGNDNWTGHAVLTGEKESGTLRFSDPGMTDAPGTYSKDGKNITLRITNAGWVFILTGTFSSKDKMGGTWTTEGLPNNSGNWEFSRDGSAAGHYQTQSRDGNKGLTPDK